MIGSSRLSSSVCCQPSRRRSSSSSSCLSTLAAAGSRLARWPDGSCSAGNVGLGWQLSDSTSEAQLLSLSSLSSKVVSWLVGISEMPARRASRPTAGSLRSADLVLSSATPRRALLCWATYASQVIPLQLGQGLPVVGGMLPLRSVASLSRMSFRAALRLLFTHAWSLDSTISACDR